MMQWLTVLLMEGALNKLLSAVILLVIGGLAIRVVRKLLKTTLEKTRLEVDAWDRWDEHFAGFLALGALLVLAAASLSMAAARRIA